ncbi:type 1 glutamine amidotransferase domain-containing protein [Phytohabitans suffuscus]|uniref:Peptidase C56 PfpI n=1 Tax=Phytohabitans suffuscus TaxID=624315 RepID=A0A6F8YJS1_9ACTN|nr:type 1 glutamine amidotransferase domain-containing protein [Phytohabitans suffuscus]BCB86201.1 peptidase C56 PfpI [Phytohabitans suffuscus]
MSHLEGKKIAILATDGVERVELEQPRGALHGAGAQTEVISIHPGEIQARQSDLIRAGTFAVDREIGNAAVDDYDALVLPGGAVSPDRLRMDRDAVSFVRAFVTSDKPIAAICHGPWMLIEADAVSGRRMTSFPSLHNDLRRAGATVMDEGVVVDERITTSRGPADLPAFCSTIVDQFAKAPQRAMI